MKKYIYLVIALLTILSLSSCGKTTLTSQELTAKEQARVQELNKTQGGRGINYDYKGPNTNPTKSLTPIE